MLLCNSQRRRRHVCASRHRRGSDPIGPYLYVPPLYCEKHDVHSGPFRANALHATARDQDKPPEDVTSSYSDALKIVFVVSDTMRPGSHRATHTGLWFEPNHGADCTAAASPRDVWKKSSTEDSTLGYDDSCMVKFLAAGFHTVATINTARREPERGKHDLTAPSDTFITALRTVVLWVGE